jgi:L,D-transpeptidase YcbB
MQPVLHEINAVEKYVVRKREFAKSLSVKLVGKLKESIDSPKPWMGQQERTMRIKYIVKKSLVCSAMVLALIPISDYLATGAFTGNANAQTYIQRGTNPQPQNFFEALFPHLMDQRVERRHERGLRRYEWDQRRHERIQRRYEWNQRRHERVQPVEIEKINSPQYYNYSPQKLVRIDLDALVPMPAEFEDSEKVSAEPATFESDEPRSAEGRGNRERAYNSSPSAYDIVAHRFADLSVLAEPQIASEIVEHYQANPQLLWLNDDLTPNARAHSVLKLLETADEYGLQPSDYEVVLPELSDIDKTEEAARFEIEMTARVVRYAMDAAAGRVNPNKLSGYHDFPENRISAAQVLDRLANGSLPAATLLSFHPDNAFFQALKTELANIESQTVGLIVIPASIMVRPGDTHEQIPHIVAAIKKRGSPELSARAETVFEQNTERHVYSPGIVALVKDFQKENALASDGVVGPNTVAKLTDIDPQTRRERVIAAMERLRWHPEDLGERHVFINQPAFRARYVVDGRSQLDMRVVVGTRANQTSFFYDTIETVEYNPYWGLPRSILVNEYLTKLRQNPAYFDERGYEVTDRNGRRISSAAINWNRVGSNPPYDVRQLPGPRNALGELKILFPNKHAIYMHDTPAKNLFDRSVRAFSHGCVRLHDPRAMAAAVLGKDRSHIAEKVRMGHSQEAVPGNIPVYVAYFTAWPTDNGEVEYFADAYGRDEHLLKAMEATRSMRGAAS